MAAPRYRGNITVSNHTFRSEAQLKGFVRWVLPLVRKKLISFVVKGDILPSRIINSGLTLSNIASGALMAYRYPVTGILTLGNVASVRGGTSTRITLTTNTGQTLSNIAI